MIRIPDSFERFRNRQTCVSGSCLFLFDVTASLILLYEMILDRSEPKLFKVEKLCSLDCTNVSSRNRFFSFQ